MRTLFHIDDTIPNKISYWLLAGFLITLPFDFFYSEIILVCFAVHTCIHCKKIYLNTLFSKELLVLISIYLLNFISIIYSPDQAEGFSIAIRQLVILLIPLLFALNGLDIKKYRINLFIYFALACSFTIIYLYADAIHTILYFHLPMSSLFTLVFMNHNFSLPIEMHATYLSMYVAFSIITLAYVILQEKRRNLNFFYTACILILTMGMLQLSSRAVCIALLLVITIVFPFIAFSGKKRVWFIIIAITMSLLLFFAFLNIDSFKVRYVNELKKDLTQKADLIEITEPRIVRWGLIIDLIKRSPVIGHGQGAEKNLLKEKYFENKLYLSYLNEFNTHNEYLSFLLKTGIIGLALFIFVLYFGTAAAWRKKDLLFLSFLFLIIIVCVSENVLDLNKGIFFYSFFFSVFLLKDKYHNKTRNHSLPINTGNPG